MKVIEVRFVVEDDVDTAQFIRSVGLGMEVVAAAVPLDNNGFGHLLPVYSARQIFVDTNDDQVEIERLLALGQ